MDITITNGTDSRLVDLRGRFDAHEVEGFATTVNPLLEAGVSVLGIDLAQVDFIDSSALAELVRLSKASRAAGLRFELYRPSDPVRVILELTGLDKAFVIHQERPEGAVTPA